MKTLIIVDVQKDFIDGALHNKEAIKRIPNIIKEIKNTDAKYVFFTQDTHFETSYLNHIICFAAEESRATDTVVNIDSFSDNIQI